MLPAELLQTGTFYFNDPGVVVTRSSPDSNICDCMGGTKEILTDGTVEIVLANPTEIDFKVTGAPDVTSGLHVAMRCVKAM